MDRTLDTSVCDLPKEELLCELSNLKALYLLQKSLCEEKTQELFDCKRQLNLSKTLENDLNQEIELLQKLSKSERDIFQQTIQKLEDELKHVKGRYQLEIDQLQKENAAKADEINSLQEMLENTGGAGNCSGVFNPEQCEKLIMENMQLKDELNALADANSTQTSTLNRFIDDNAAMKETIADLEGEIEQLRQNVEYKKEELDNINEIYAKCQEEFILIKNEFDMMKNDPLDHGAKGNSLFAEVDDRRVQLQKNNDVMKSKFLDMKKQLAQKISELADCRAENARISRRWEEDMDEKIEQEDDLKKAFQAQIRDLNLIIASYETQLAQKTSMENFRFSDSNGQMQFVERMMQRKTDDVTKLNTELGVMTLCKTMLAQRLREAQSDTQKWRASATRAQNDIDVLKATIADLKLRASSSNGAGIEKTEEQPKKSVEQIAMESVYADKLKIMRKTFGSFNVTEEGPAAADRDNSNKGQIKEEAICKVEEKENDGCGKREEQKKRVGFASGTKSESGESSGRVRRSYKPVYQTLFVQSDNKL